MRKLFSSITNNAGLLAILFFLAFIPLYPKLPIINIIRTWVYIRLEDFLVAAAIGTYILVRLYKRRFPASPLTWPIFTYWALGLVSALFSLSFIGPRLTGYFPHLVIFHYARRIEYMMLFFMAFDVIAHKKSRITAVIVTLTATVTGIIVYGLGQKFWGWPAFLTMNEEFAKGIPLRLPSTARIPSTFGGHYDLAAFMVFVIPILVTLLFAAKKIWQKCIFFILSTGALIMLLLTESRTSFLVYLVGITATLVWYKKKLYIIPVILLSFFLLNFVKGASERFYKTFRYNDVIVDLSTGKPVGTLASLEGGTAVIQKSASPAVENLPTGSQYIGLPSSATASGQVKTISYMSVNLASGSGEIATVSGSFLIQKALVYDISITTRFQAEWPNAIDAFKRNIFLGSGYSTLSVASDGDYVRMLGETGILGSLGFLGILLVAYVLFFKQKEALEGYSKAFVVGVFGGLTGLMFNAILIDVFEASKVAFTLWLLLGVAMALLTTDSTSLTNYFRLLWRALTHQVAYCVYLFLAGIMVFGSSVSNYFVADDFTWLKWAASSSFADISTYFSNAQGFFYRPIPKLWYFILYAVFWLKPEGYHVMSLALYGLCSYLVYLCMRMTGVKKAAALISSLMFAVLSVHHENVFWISGQSSLLAAVFLFGSIVVYLSAAPGRSFWKTPQRVVSMALMILAMLSYDGMIVAPIILFIIAWTVSGKKQWVLVPLIAIPLYWGIRTMSGAVPPSGDYGYKLTTLPFNFVGNSVGYIVATFAGPRSVEWWSTLREYLRLHRFVAAGLGIGIAGLCIYAIRMTRRIRNIYKYAILWFVCGLVSLGAYVGLGNMSERYVLVASGFFVISFGALFSAVWSQNTRQAWKYAAVVFAGSVISWNIFEVGRVSSDWKRASDISQHTLLTMNHQFFPLRENKSFIFVATPIRYGRAWIFPTGLSDPLWHEFRFNQFGYTTTNAATPEEAYTVAVPTGYSPETFIFENYTLKRMVKIEQTVAQ